MRLSNLWLGVSVENQKTADERIPLLLQTPAAHRFISYEPALSVIDFAPYLPHVIPSDTNDGTGYMTAGLDWLIMGGESGPGARPMHPDWARSARDQCKAAGVPFFLKQNGEWEGDKSPLGINANDVYLDGVFMRRVGKKAADCLLDGKEHKEMPR